MPANRFEALARRQEGLAVIDMRGEIDAAAEAVLDAAYEAAITDDPPTILLNFAEVGFINSTGIALIVSLLAEARKGHRTVLASGLSPHYREIFQITRLADFMTIYPDERTAMSTVGTAAS